MRMIIRKWRKIGWWSYNYGSYDYDCGIKSGRKRDDDKCCHELYEIIFFRHHLLHHLLVNLRRFMKNSVGLGQKTKIKKSAGKPPGISMCWRTAPKRGKDIRDMIKILFICHGNILKSPQKASKINGFTKRKGAYYTITTPFLKEPWCDKFRYMRTQAAIFQSRGIAACCM